jgi:uncharacterized membrane protein
VTATLRKTWLDLKASYWFIPTLLTLFTIGLSALTIHLDRRGAAEWLIGTGWLETSGAEGARGQLSVIASAMISIASTVFAITIAAVVYASGNYGPRLLTNFMSDRGNQVSLGVFIATFVYALMTLRVVHSEGETGQFVPHLSLLVSTGLVLLAVAVLVYFLHHVPASIRINAVLAGIGRALIKDIEERFPEGRQPPRPQPATRGEALTATEVGYIEIIEFAALDQIARKEGATISLQARTGDFVHPHLPLLEISGAPLGGDLAERLRACFSLGASRTRAQDLEFLIDELVEIALRALSPGVNDPFTAVTSIHWMAAAMAKLADRELGYGPEHETYAAERVQPVADDFDHYLRRSFGEVRASAAANTIAARVFLEALAGVARGVPQGPRRAAIAREARQLVRQAECELQGPALEELKQRYREFEPELVFE